MDLILIEIGNEANDEPREGTAEVHNLMHHEGHNTCREYIVLHPRVPRRPQQLEDIEFLVRVVLAELIVVAPERICRRIEGGIGRVPVAISPAE